MTAGDSALLFDGSDVGLGGEDISGASIDATTGVVYFSILGNFNLAGVGGGDGDDVSAFTGSTGEATSGAFAAFFDGDIDGFGDFGGEQTTAVHVVFDDPTPAGEANLAISKAVDADPVIESSTVTYTITVDNAGPDTAVNVVVTDTLPPGVTFVETFGCTPQDPNGVPACSLGDIISGGNASYTVSVTVDAGTTGIILNTA